MLFDSHMHTELSSDSSMSLSSVLEKTKELNIGAIITEHLDLNYPIEDQFRVNLPLFFEKYSPFKSDSLLLGIEIGLGDSILEENLKISKSYPFDSIQASIHAIDDKDIYSSFSKEPISKEEYFKTYFNRTIKYISDFSNFDSLSHIDYPCRYCNFDSNEFSISEHGTYLKKIFNILITRNQALEINTRRLNIPNVYTSMFEVYKLYKLCGGKFVTLGSDSHDKESIATNFDIALEICEKLSLTPVYFKNRKIQFMNK